MARLNGGGVSPAVAITDTYVVANVADLITLTLAKKGDVGIVTGTNETYILQNDPYSTPGNWVELLSNSVIAGGANVGNVAFFNNPYTIIGNNDFVWDNTNFNFKAGQTNTVISGNHNAMFGQNNTVTGTDMLIAGNSNTITGNDGIVSGIFNGVTGDQVLLVGDQNSVTSYRNLTVGRVNNVSGNTNAVVGEGIAVSGNNNAAFGASHSVTNTLNLVAGDNNFITGNNNVVGGGGNQIAGQYNGVFGQSNTGNSVGSNSVVGGFQNNIENQLNAVFGTQNNVTGSRNIVGGEFNQVTGGPGIANLVAGSTNTVTAGLNVVVGETLNVSGTHNAVFGQTNTTTGNHNLMTGENNTSTTTGTENTHQIISGINNSVEDNYCGIVAGDGISLTGAGTGFNYAFGTNHTINGGQFDFVNGNGNSVSGEYNAVFGQGHTVINNYNAVFGQGNTITGGNNHFIAGVGNTVSGDNGTGVIGNSNNLSVALQYCFVIGYQNTIGAANEAYAFGAYNTVNGAAAFAFGESHDVEGGYTEAHGVQAQTWNTGQIAQSGGQFAAVGDAQTSIFVMRKQTTDATPTELAANGVAERIYTLDNKAYLFRISVIARNTGAQETAGYTLEFVFDRAAGVGTSRISGITKNVVHEDVAAWDVTATADLVSGKPLITVTGELAKTIQWVARVEMTQVG